MRIGVDYRVLAVGRELIDRGLGRFTQQQLRAVLTIDQHNEYVVVCNEPGNVSLLDPAVARAPNVEIRRFVPEVAGTIPPEPTSFLRQAEEFQSWLSRQRIDVYHATTPFVVQPPLLARFDACPMVANFYDVIPLVYPGHYLTGWQAEQYERTLTFLLDAERLIAISDAARTDAVVYLGFPGDRIDVAWPVPDSCFRPLTPDAVRSGLARIRHRLPLPDQFVLTVSHSHHTKNLRTLLRAYALLPPDLRADLPLVVCCHLDPRDAELLEETASRFGVADDVITTGLVSDSELAVLYNTAPIVVHPSRHEGFGLPVAEAMSCGTPVITTNSSSLPEVAGDAAELVDPDDAEGLAERIRDVHDDPARRELMVQRGFAQVLRFNCDQLARTTLETYDKLVARPEPQVHRPRIAVWSPMPPQASGIADYTVELLDGLRDRYDLEVFVDDGCLPPADLLRRFRIHHLSAFARRHSQPFDLIVYQLGRSLLHLYMDEAMTAHPGVVVLHDLAWSHVLRAGAQSPDDIDRFRRRVVELEGAEAGARLDAIEQLPLSTRQELLDEFLGRHLMLGGVVDAGPAQVVHVRQAEEEVRRRYPAANVRTVPMGVTDPYRSNPAARYLDARTALEIPAFGFVVGVFGVVDPLKRVETTLVAMAELSPIRPDSLLLVVGESPDEDYLESLRRQSRSLGLQARVRFTGRVPSPRFTDLMVACDVVVNLRSRSTMHMSAVALRAAAAAKPVVISDLAEWRSLPEGPFLRVPSGKEEVPTLARHLRVLATQHHVRLASATRARHYFMTNATIDVMADAYARLFDDLLPGTAVPASADDWCPA